MGHEKTLLRGTSVLVISAIFTAIFGYIFRTILARSFTVYEYGLFYAVFSLVTTIIPFKDLGLSLTVTRFIPEFLVKGEKDKIKNSIVFLFIFQTIVYALGLLLIFNFSSAFSDAYFSDARANTLLILLIFAFFFSTLGSVFGATFLGHKKMAYASFFEIFFSVSLVAVFIILNTINRSIYNTAWAYLISYILLVILEFFAFLKIIPDIFRHKLNISMKLVKQLFSFSIFSFSGGMLKALFINSGTILLTLFSSLENVAYYNIALPTANLGRFLMKPLAIVILPISSEIKARNRELTALSLLYKYSSMVFLPMIIYAMFFSSAAINILFGEKYELAAAALVILLVGYLLLLLIEINNSVLLGYDEPKKGTMIFLVLLVVNLVLSYFLIPAWNFVGAAMAFTISSLITFMVSIITLKEIVKIDIEVKEHLKTLLAAALLFVVLHYLEPFTVSFNLFLRILIFIFSGGLIYIVSLFLLKIISVKEIRGLLARFSR